MSLSEERVIILKMLEEGKITSEDAAKLLEALENNNKKTSNNSESKQQKQSNFQDEVVKMREKLNDWRKEFKNNYNQKDFDKTMDDFAHKAENLGKTVAFTTLGIVDKVVDYVGSFVDTNSFNFFSKYTPIDIKNEAIAKEGMDLVIEAVNGHISIKKYSGDKVIINSTIKGPENTLESVVSFNEENNAIFLRLGNISNISVSHDILLPVVKFNSIKLSSINGRVYVEDSISDSFEATTKNSHIELMGVHSNKIFASTKNAKIQLSYVTGHDIKIDTNNANIDVKHVKAKNISATTLNGKIVFENIQNIDNEDEVYLKLKTTHGGIKINMNDMDNRGYSIKSKTTNGSINLLIPDLMYGSVNSQNHRCNEVQAESRNLKDYSGRVYIDAETINNYIEIVK